MAQNRKASEEVVRQTLREAVASAGARLKRATDEYAAYGSIQNLRNLQVATDELADLNGELRQHDDDRDPEAVRRADANPKRNRHSWPAGKAYDPAPPRRRTSPRPDPADRKPPLPPPPPARPAALASREAADGSKERVSWWVGADRTALAKGAKVVAVTPPPKTASAPASKAATKASQQQHNDAKRDAKREALSGKLQDALQPMAGAFSKIPMAE